MDRLGGLIPIYMYVPVSLPVMIATKRMDLNQLLKLINFYFADINVLVQK